jgi:DNA-binding transcriptional MerR regulator
MDSCYNWHYNIICRVVTGKRIASVDYESESAKSMAEAAVKLESQEIPDKLYFRIGEVAKLAGVKQYVLRFWESEFPGLGPKKSGTGHRLYRRKDVEMVLEIKRLLYEKRYTIEGARQFLEGRPKGAAAIAAAAATASAAPAKSEPKKKRQQAEQASLFGYGPSPEVVAAMRQELEAILKILKD